MEESDMKKTTFRAGSSNLCEFTRMTFVLSNAGSSICHLMEQCLGDKQFVSSLLYVDNICIFAPDMDAMIDCIEMVFKWPKEMHLKIEPQMHVLC